LECSDVVASVGLNAGDLAESRCLIFGSVDAQDLHLQAMVFLA